MATLAIEGHPKRGNEVIGILEMLGGSNPHNYCADCDSLCFTIGKGTNIIYYDWVKECYEDEDTLVFTLEEFLEKFPYKVGDKVQHKGATSCGSIFEVEEMRWEENTVKYTLCLFGCNYKRFTLPAEYLQPYKEETIKESIDKTNKVIFDTQAQSCDIMNDIIKEDKEEIDIIEPITEINLNHPCFDEHNEIELIIPNGWKFEQRGNKMFGIRKQYPKTYEECCDILDIYPIYNKPNLCICEWHPETKTLNKLVEPKFKVGDRIRNNISTRNEIIKSIEWDRYILACGQYVKFTDQDEYELVQNKFDINTLKAFDKVLVRCDNNGLWNPQFFAKYRPHSKFPFTCTYNSWSQCVPYEGNEHLLGTIVDCDEFYKTWE